MFTNILFDLKYAWRLLLKTPGYSLFCVLIVALSVGLAMWSYELTYSVARKPLPFPDSEHWFSVQISAKPKAAAKPSVDAYTYQELLKYNRTVKHLGAYSSQAAVLSDGQASTSLRGIAISTELLTAMRVAPQIGRLFEKADSHEGAAPVVILSFNTWQNYFAADPAIVGKQTRIDGRPTQVVGVMPQDFFAFQDFELWLPLHLSNLVKPSDSSMMLSPLILLDQDQSADAALNEMRATVSDVNTTYPQLFDAGRQLELFPAYRMLTHGMVQFVAMISFIAAAVLLLGCVNISMVFFARLLERSSELALRTALGSSRGRLLRQCLLESVLIVLLGLLIAVGLAALGIRWGQSIGEVPARILGTGRSGDLLALRFGDIVAAFTIATVLWLLSTLIPAWRIAKQDAALVLGGSSKGLANSGGSKIVSVLVGLEVLVSCVVLVICVNLVMAVKQEVSKPTGLDTALTPKIMLSTYPSVFSSRYADAPTRLRYWDELTANIEGRMAGAAVAYITSAPTRPSRIPVVIESQEESTNRGALLVPVTAVSDNYFAMLGLRLRAGRLFDSTDNDTSLAVVVLDERLAEHYWPGQSVLGKRIQLNPNDSTTWLTVIGIVSHVGAAPYRDDFGVAYQSLRQAVPSAFQVMVKLPASVTDGRLLLRAAAYSIDQELPLHNLQMLDEYLQALDVSYNALSTAFSAIAAITVILAASGLFGLIARSVAQRTQEVGVRRALGGTKWQVTAVFLRQGLTYLCVGLVGVCLGIVVTSLLTGMIPNILDRVVQVTIGVFLLMACVIFGASYLPTRRAVSLEPGDALRHE